MNLLERAAREASTVVAQPAPDLLRGRLPGLVHNNDFGNVTLGRLLLLAVRGVAAGPILQRASLVRDGRIGHDGGAERMVLLHDQISLPRVRRESKLRHVELLPFLSRLLVEGLLHGLVGAEGLRLLAGQVLLGAVHLRVSLLLELGEAPSALRWLHHVLLEHALVLVVAPVSEK